MAKVGKLKEKRGVQNALEYERLSCFNEKLGSVGSKKAIDIANALLNDGYTDDRAIPIATSQAEKWLENASEEEKKEFRKEKILKKMIRIPKIKMQKLLTANVQVKFEEDKWIVLSEGAKRASDHFNIKEDAIARAKEIAENKKLV